MLPVKVFVYGTLKKGYSNHKVLGDSKLLGKATTAPKYMLYDCGWYPCMIEKEDGRSIEGEIYEVFTAAVIDDLDELEGVDFGLYRRETIDIIAPEGITKAIGYIYNRSVSKFLDCGVSWPRE